MFLRFTLALRGSDMIRAVLFVLLFGRAASLFAAVHPLQLDPGNAHYFLFRGKPIILITSGEHYGAVLNLDFDYRRYLDTLAKDGLNGTRTWSGAYCEPANAFAITGNSLAPSSGRFICPWARGAEPGYANGGNKFDLDQWDPAYFKRLRDFMYQAGRRGILVELNLFCPFYEETMWRLSPMHASNNINGLALVSRTNVYTLDKHGGLLAVQERMVRKLAAELKTFDNFYFEICNEPYFGGVTLEWQHHIADIITQAEQHTRVHHLISQNIANGKARVENPHPAVSIFNFHYANPPEAVAMNWDWNRVIGENETGFQGTNDSTYRMEAWDFVIAGGGLFNNLDYSFSAGHEDGTFVYPAGQPGGGSPTLRRQLAGLRRFMSQFDLDHLQPEKDALRCSFPPGASARVLAKPGEQYAVYVRTSTAKRPDAPAPKTHFADGDLALGLSLPAGEFAAEWWDTKQGTVLKRETWKHPGNERNLVVPAFEQDIALAVRRTR
jgi:hypothetical protein